MAVLDEIKETEEEVEEPRSSMEMRFASRVRHDLDPMWVARSSTWHI
jgi:hypothetical protein